MQRCRQAACDHAAQHQRRMPLNPSRRATDAFHANLMVTL
jgi:hypothetical protein